MKFCVVSLVGQRSRWQCSRVVVGVLAFPVEVEVACPMESTSMSSTLDCCGSCCSGCVVREGCDDCELEGW